MLIDTHAHLNFAAFKDDADQVIKRTLENNVWMINVGSQYGTSQRAVIMAEKYPTGVYAAVGLHPIHAGEKSKNVRSFSPSLSRSESSVFDYEKYKKLAESKKTVAIGEIGLDYKAEYVSLKEKQKEILFQQMALAKESDLPVIFHCRMAHDELIDILELKGKNLKGVVHCFTGSQEQAKKYLEMGFYLGLNGIIFKFDIEEVIKKTPLDKILIETDCPYLTPSQEQGRNEPLYVKHIVHKIAEIKNMDFEKLAGITTQNAKNLFSI